MRRSCLFLLSLVSCLFPLLPARAQNSPAFNDNFANRFPLTTGVEWDGTTDGATREADEPDPPLVTRQDTSVWFTWTAPSTGWFQLYRNPLAYEPRVYLAPWRGDSLASLRFVHSNEMSLYLQAKAGDVYQFSLAGDGTGGVGIASGVGISPANPPRFEVTQFTLSSSSVDVGSQAQTVDVTFTVNSESPSGGGAQVEAGGLLTRPFGPADRVSGDETQGTYRVTFSIPHGLAARNLWFSIHWNGQGDSQDAAGIQTYVPFSIPDLPVLQVLNSGTVDTIPPVLKSFALERSILDVSTGLDYMVFSAEALDSQSGVLSVQVAVYDSTGVEVAYGSADPPLPGTPDSSSGTRRGSIGLYRNRPSGDYYLKISVYDYNGNSSDYVSTQPGFPGPFQGAVKITRDLAQAAYETWCRAAFGAASADSAISAKTADPDKDGITNLMEFALGLNPLSGEGGSGISLVPQDGKFLFQYSKPAGQEYVEYIVTTTGDPAKRWSRVLQWHRRFTVGDREWRSVPLPAGYSRFFRLEVLE